jgi:acyl dehydratase
VTAAPAVTSAATSLRYDADELAGYRSLIATALPQVALSSRQPSPLHAFLASHASFTAAVAELAPGTTTVVHLSQEIRLRRLLRASDELQAFTEVVAVRPDPRGLRAVLDCRVVALDPASGSTDASPAPEVARLTAQVLLVGAPDRPAHGVLPPPAVPVTSNDSVTTSFRLDQDFVHRYADLAHDHNPIHIDAAAARSAGFDGPIVHGMSVLAVVVEDAVHRFAGGDAARLRGTGVRFSGPVRPGQRVEVDYRLGLQPGSIAFSCRADGRPALKSGWLDLSVTSPSESASTRGTTHA